MSLSIFESVNSTFNKVLGSDKISYKADDRTTFLLPLKGTQEVSWMRTLGTYARNICTDATENMAAMYGVSNHFPQIYTLITEKGLEVTITQPILKSPDATQSEGIGATHSYVKGYAHRLVSTAETMQIIFDTCEQIMPEIEEMLIGMGVPKERLGVRPVVHVEEEKKPQRAEGGKTFWESPDTRMPFHVYVNDYQRNVPQHLLEAANYQLQAKVMQKLINAGLGYQSDMMLCAGGKETNTLYSKISGREKSQTPDNNVEPGANEKTVIGREITNTAGIAQ